MRLLVSRTGQSVTLTASVQSAARPDTIERDVRKHRSADTSAPGARPEVVSIIRANVHEEYWLQALFAVFSERDR